MARMCKYGESKMTRIMMATVPHITSRLGLRKFQADGFLLIRVYSTIILKIYILYTETVLHYVVTFPSYSSLKNVKYKGKIR